MKKIERRILINHVFANSQNVCYTDHAGDTEFAGDDAYEKPERMQSIGAKANTWVCDDAHEKSERMASVGATANAWVGGDAYETNEWHELGGEG